MSTASNQLDGLVAQLEREHRAGRLDEAAAVCREILAIHPGIAEIHNELGIILAQQGKLDQAVAPLEQAIALQPDRPRLTTTSA